MNQSFEPTTAHLDNTTINIKQGHLSIRTNDKGSCSTSSSPMDDAFMSSEDNYAERVAAQNNMDMEVSHPSLPSDVPSYDFTLPPSQPPCISHEETPNPTSIGEICMSMEPFPPMVIPYSANVPADSSLWDGNFMATFLFGTNEFLNSDICNIVCFLQCMAYFLRQRNLERHNGNNIPQLELFGKSCYIPEIWQLCNLFLLIILLKLIIVG